jgi:mRNA interferase MazF
MKPRRGEVWWVRLDPTLGSEIRKTRPCLVVGSNVLNERRHTVVVIPLSTAPQAAPPVLVPVVCMGRRAVAVVDQIRAVAQERLTRRVGEISVADLTSVEDALRVIFEL